MAATDRRAVLRMLGAAGVGLLGLESIWSTLRFARAPVSYGPPTRRALGSPDRYPPGVLTWVEDARVFVINDGGALRALSATCTHLGCTVRRLDQGFVCPCHGSRYDDQGRVLGGPAPRPLRYVELSLDRRGRLVVDTAVEVASTTRLRVG